jgi:hypothetical protein
VRSLKVSRLGVLLRGSPPFKQLIGQAIEHINIFSSGVEGKYHSRAAVERDSSQAPMGEFKIVAFRYDSRTRIYTLRETCFLRWNRPIDAHWHSDPSYKYTCNVYAGLVNKN